jgi:hypothetical protein
VLSAAQTGIQISAFGRGVTEGGTSALRQNEDAMTRTVPCPECHRPARVLDSFVVRRSAGTLRFLRLQCEGPLSFLVSAEELDGESLQLPRDPIGNDARRVDGAA